MAKIGVILCNCFGEIGNTVNLESIRERLASDPSVDFVTIRESLCQPGDASAVHAMLRERGRGVAQTSLHMQGRALDFRLPGVNTYLIWKTARAMQRGGTGYYRDSDFVHIDTGRVRFW